MPHFRTIPDKPDFPAIEKKILEKWKSQDIFEQSITNREQSTPYVFLEGPPTANGMPHPGHVLTRVVKDSICRYQTMRGHKVLRKAGWDTHGLPVEIEVERELGLNNKKDIEEYGIAAFNKKCRESVFRYEQMWRDLTERIGFWVDLDDPYITLNTSYIESVWWSLRQIWDKGLLYKGYRITPYCPRCGTPLSSHEVAQGYQSIEDPSVYVKFPLKNKKNYFFLAWTTTPWTLISNVALAVGKDIKYVEIDYENETLILAKALIPHVFSDPPPINKEYSGKDLEGWEYQQLYPQITVSSKAHYITLAEFVSTEEGTGIVHIAPAFGEDDMQIGRQYNLPIVQPVDTQGRFTDEIPFIAGLFVKDADPKIISDLKTRTLLFKSTKYRHDYPFCWRCDTPLLYYAREAWFIEMTKLREQLMSNNETVSWFPNHIKHGRFGNFLDSVKDWSLSRERYWGTPLPIWVCKKCSHRHMIGSISELKEMAIKIPDELDLHRPIIDNVELRCPKCKDAMYRVPEVIDTWYDSGSAPFAQWHYPFENEAVFQKNFPVDFISEAIDQTRGWFYSLLAISTCVFDKAPYRNVLTLGHIQDAKGQKMSKSKGNTMDPWVYLEREGADSFRWYFLSRRSPGESFRFLDENVTEVYRRFINTLWNSFSFFVTYANIDNYNPAEKAIPYKKRRMLDQWLISRLNHIISDINEEMSQFNLHKVTRKIEDFVINDLSNWYIRLSRRVFWKPEQDSEKKAAYDTLWEALTTICKYAAPFIPFLTDYIYDVIEAPYCSENKDSVHLADLPLPNTKIINTPMEEQMNAIMDVIQTGRGARAKAKIKSRQPIGEVIIIQKDEHVLLDNYRDLILSELNAKKLQFDETLDKYISYQIRPNFASLGKKFKGSTKSVVDQLSQIEPYKIVQDLRTKHSTNLNVDSKKVKITEEDIEIVTTDRDNYAMMESAAFAVIIKTDLSESLIMEGLMRDLVRHIQQFRKDLNLSYTQKILLSIDGNPEIIEMVKTFKPYIMEETLSESVAFTILKKGEIRTWTMNNFEITIEIQKAT